MEHHNLPLPLRERLLTYYKSQRQHRQLHVDATHALEDLPVYLRREMQVRQRGLPLLCPTLLSSTAVTLLLMMIIITRIAYSSVALRES